MCYPFVGPGVEEEEKRLLQNLLSRQLTQSVKASLYRALGAEPCGAAPVTRPPGKPALYSPEVIIPEPLGDGLAPEDSD